MSIKKFFILLQLFSFGSLIVIYLSLLYDSMSGNISSSGGLATLILVIIFAIIITLFVNPPILYMLLKRQKKKYPLLKTSLISTLIFLTLIVFAGTVLGGKEVFIGLFNNTLLGFELMFSGKW